MNYKEIEGHPKYIIFKTGKIYSKITKRFIKPCLRSKNKYLGVSLNNITYNLHRVLALHFIDNPENKPQVDHIDRNKLNNNLSNLRWVTISENNHNTGCRKDSKLKEKNIAEKLMGGHMYYRIEIRRKEKYYTRCFRKDKYTLEECVAFREAMLEDIDNLN